MVGGDGRSSWTLPGVSWSKSRQLIRLWWTSGDMSRSPGPPVVISGNASGSAVSVSRPGRSRRTPTFRACSSRCMGLLAAKSLTSGNHGASAGSRGQAPEIRQPEGSNQQARCASSEHVGDRRSHRRVVGHRRGQEGRFTTSRGICAISLTGVYNWRSHLAPWATGKTCSSRVAAS